MATLKEKACVEIFKKIHNIATNMVPDLQDLT